MKKYKINRDKKTKEAIPSDRVIEKYRDFNQLRVSYNDVTKRSKIPLYKNKKMFLFLLLIALVAWVVSEEIAKEKQEDSTEINVPKK